MSRSRSSSMSSPSQAGVSSGIASTCSATSSSAIEARAPADAVDRLEAAGRHEPGPRIGGHAVARPLLERGAEGVVQRLLGEVEVAEQADQRGEDAARLGAVDGVRRRARVCGLIVARRWTPRGRGRVRCHGFQAGYSSLECSHAITRCFGFDCLPRCLLRVHCFVSGYGPSTTLGLWAESLTGAVGEKGRASSAFARASPDRPAAADSPGSLRDAFVLPAAVKIRNRIASFLRFGCGNGRSAPVRAADRAAGKRRAYALQPAVNFT